MGAGAAREISTPPTEKRHLVQAQPRRPEDRAEGAESTARQGHRDRDDQGQQCQRHHGHREGDDHQLTSRPRRGDGVLALGSAHLSGGRAARVPVGPFIAVQRRSPVRRGGAGAPGEGKSLCHMKPLTESVGAPCDSRSGDRLVLVLAGVDHRREGAVADGGGGTGVDDLRGLRSRGLGGHGGLGRRDGFRRSR